ncbi:MAG: Hsp20/alpha crystallin family protein [Saprospiraceae bacterium]|nr:Hsp20/alpha crystallin family protein [Saprospiraceae bacterium]
MITKPVHYRWNGAKISQENMRLFRPNVNVVETDTNYELQVFLPGWDKSEVDVTVEKGILTIASSKEWTSEQGQTWKHREFVPSAFKRSFVLPDNVLAHQITANAHHGVLTITLEKQPLFRKTITVA